MEKLIYNFGTSFVNNYVYFHNDKMILIDTGYENDYNHFKKIMEKAGFTLSMIDYVFITHSHSDHVGFLKRLLEVNKKALIISSLEAKERMKTGQNQKAFYVGSLSSFLGKLTKSRISYPFIDDDKRFIPYTDQNKELLKDMLGGEIIETTGHTKDSLSLLLTNKKMFIGDAAMNIPLSFHKASFVIEDLSSYIRSWQKIIELKPFVIYPGHGKTMKINDLTDNIIYLSKISLK